MVVQSSPGSHGSFVTLKETCPLCSSSIKSFFINMNVKILMCENTLCEFPFGHEEVQYIEEDNEVDCGMERSISRHAKGSTSTSSISNAAWLEIEKMNRVYESEDSQFEVKNFDLNVKNKNKNAHVEEKIANDVKILKNVKDIKGLTKQLNGIDGGESSEVIKNEKWIKNLMNLQGLSGVQLLKEQEIQQIRRDEPVFGGGELKIDIDRNTSMSSIKIEIMNQDTVTVDNLT
ncbi:uncharacterized protein [Battus philenor]|uniref:uncharacterized protein n=1 Tax=Battus philenor TaxID=42288 RepID=UPI0035CF6E86